MNSHSQTKSLDRDLPHRKRKSYFPQSVVKVCNAAEHNVCHYHNEIEDIFGTYTIDQFCDNLPPDKVSNLINSLKKEGSFNDDDLTKINIVLNNLNYEDYSNDPYDLLNRYINFVIASDKLLMGINSKLAQSITGGLIRYCVSLANYCTSDIDFIVNYEKIIQRNEPEIVKEVKDISKQYREFKKVTSSNKLILYSIGNIIDKVRQIRASINKLYYLVTEWVDEERNYPSNLSEKMKSIKSQIFTIQQRSDISRESIVQRQTRLNNLDKHIHVLRKNQAILRRKHRRIQHSQHQIDLMIKQLENQLSPRNNDTQITEKKVNHRENLKIKTTKKENKFSKKPHTEQSTATCDQNVLRIKQDNQLALDRHRERLNKLDLEMEDKIEATEREILANESTRDKLLTSLKEDNETQVKDLEKLKELYPMMEDLNFVFTRKNSPETLRQLHDHGRIVIQNKELKFVDKMCEKVAKAVPEKWRELYLNLPFYPSRLSDKRFGDIEIIDLVSARNHSNDIKRATMSLNKWRLFYHNATAEHLIEGLKKSNLNDIAKEIEELTAKSKHRYEDE